MKLVTPNYSARSPIVNENGFNDQKIGSPDTTYNPGASAGPLPNGPPKYVSPVGRRVQAKGLTNKRLTSPL